MALLFVDSFDHYITADRAYKGWSYDTAGTNPGDNGCTIGAYGRNSTNGLRGRCNSGGVNTRAKVGLTTSGATGVMGFGFRVNTAVPGIDFPICQVYRGSTEMLTVKCSATGTISVVRGGLGGTVLGSPSVSTITHSTYYFGEFKWTLHDSTGAYEFKVDGASYVSGTGADTIPSGAATWDGVALGGVFIGVNYTIDFDDLYVCDGSGGVNDTFLGDHRIVCKVASSGNGTHTDWSPSTGSDHGALVDENPPNTSDYNQSGTAGHRDTYNFAAVGVAGTVRAVQTVNLLKADVGGLRTVVPTFRISGSNYDGTGAVLGSDWAYKHEVHITNPDTATAWTVSDIDGAEFGVKVTA